MGEIRDRPDLYEGAARLDLHRRMPRPLFEGNSSRRSGAGIDPAGRRGREAAAHFRGITPRHGRLAVRNLREYDHSYRHENPQDRAVSARHPRPHRGDRKCPSRRGAPRGHRPKYRDAVEIASDQTWLRPRARPITAETRNSTTAMK